MPLKEVSFFSQGIQLPGVLHLPAAASLTNRAPAVVMGHGMANNRDEADQHSYLGEKLEKAGYAALRFDFRGCGQSAVPRGQMMIGTAWPQDLRAAITFLSIQPEVDPQRIGAVGSSWGGGVTVYTASIDRRIRSVVSLGAPANGQRWLRHQWVSQHGEAGWQGFLAQVAADRVRRVGGEPSGTVRLLGGFIPVKQDQVAFYEQFLADHPAIVADIPLEVADDILTFAPEVFVSRVSPSPLLIIHGMDDPLVDIQEAQSYYQRAKEPKKLLLLEGGIHQVLSGSTAEKASQAVIDWLASTL